MDGTVPGVGLHEGSNDGLVDGFGNDGLADGATVKITTCA